MTQDRDEIILQIKAKIVELADQLDNDARQLENDELIPATGLVDSTALLALMAWYERVFDVPITPDEFTIDNFGTLSLMADFVQARRTV